MKPPSAASIWVVDQTLHIEFPSSKTEKVHEITVPLTEEGLSFAVQIFRARNARSTVGTNGAPTKYQTERALLKAADAFLAAGGKVKKARADFNPSVRQSVKDVLRNLGLVG